ncbi:MULTISPECIES: DUF2076 domain-containing protein [Bradyrhizobium]|uniref:DUF2076 domain-containing protein n=2 Tax=Bradyrhizobium TaxID=374 RepID=A0ABY0PJY5_9BRAD|nr:MULTISPECIES: DUF2076 domain-containing protein [Bradyrhizobium]SDI35776.1 hypothetical protein SAMN05444163_2581 [Bradyrhizobium ottawaense]SED60922.1 hypothetical protein SAMN05444171_4587 [Bradyrhizobium lablabi]SHL58209.1 hypothetical protein SAMN05444321_3403 [Bradyrhizobium lablabi]
MTPQERQLIDDLFDRLAKLETAPRDPEAMSAIMQGLRTAPNAVYALVQTTLVQDEALRRAHDRIQELEATQTGQPTPSGGFLDSMRDAIFGQGQPQGSGSVPHVRAPDIGGGRPVWNSGQVMQQSQAPGQQYGQQYGQPQGYGQPYGAQQPAIGGGGGSFLGTAAAAAAGVVGGSLLLGSIRSMMGGGGHQQSFADSSGLGSGGGNQKPWSDQSSSDLARDAGINDINSSGSSGQRAADDSYGSRAGLFDQASNDDTDHDADGFDDDDGGDGGDGDSDFA